MSLYINFSYTTQLDVYECISFSNVLSTAAGLSFYVCFHNGIEVRMECINWWNLSDRNSISDFPINQYFVYFSINKNMNEKGTFTSIDIFTWAALFLNRWKLNFLWKTKTRFTISLAESFRFLFLRITRGYRIIKYDIGKSG